MRYRDDWKGRLRVTKYGAVVWDGDQVGLLRSFPSPGATSYKGMVTNVAWLGHPSYETGRPEASPVFQSAERAIEYILSTLPE